MSSLKKMLLLVALFLFVSPFAETCFAQDYYSMQLNNYNYFAGNLPRNIQLANAGNAQAQFEYGYCLINGIGCSRNPLLGFQLIRDSATKGFIPSVYMMGRFNLVGQFVPRNVPAAIRMFEIAATHKFPPAQVALGDCYLNGIGVPQNVQLAVLYYQAAANRGNIVAIQKLRALGGVVNN